MTEAEWLTCTDPDRMLQHVRGAPPSGFLARLRRWGRAGSDEGEVKPLSDRKVRLFACACCRRIADLMDDERSQRAVEVAELHADGSATEVERREACEAALDAYDVLLARGKASNLPIPYLPQPEPTRAWLLAARAAAQVARYPGEEAVATAIQAAMAVAAEWDDPAWAAAALGDAARVALIRDIFANPFRDIEVEPAWLGWNGNTVRRIAEGVYEERAFDRLPILHDALLDAGCDNVDILAHCRSAQGHVRGCWVIDVLLAKS
jgi:hypothetical protein